MQCPKMLWMDRNMPEAGEVSDSAQARFRAGVRVGELARDYFGEYESVPYSGDKGAMAGETTRLIDAGARTIAEASFSHDGNFCSVDILRVNENGGFEIVEVKSVAGSEEEDDGKAVKLVHLHDMAYQRYVVTGGGHRVDSVSLIQLNRDYVRRGDLDVHKLFVLRDCTGETASMQDDIESNIVEIERIAEMRDEPGVDIGRYCQDPYACAYMGWCWRKVPEDSVFDIRNRMFHADKYDLYRGGVVTMRQLLEAGVNITDRQMLQVRTVCEDLPPMIDKDAIREFLDELSYPLYHLDFETWQQVIPEFDGVRPYMQIPTQYSLHIQERPDSEPGHREFLGKEGEDPRSAIAERLCADIPMGACVLAYNMSFEKGRVKELAAAFPDLADHLMDIHDNMRDLAVPFRKAAYYCRAMKGSYSLKAVLPALFPGDPELDYNALDLVHNGDEAMNAFATLHEQPPEDIPRIRQALLDYCRIDTLAMVRILGRLYEVRE
jgi:hypothetical protein